jgi:hypothetical protein
VCNGRIDPLPDKLLDECRIAGSAQVPGSVLGADEESARAQGVDSQCCGIWARSAGAPLMIIEGILQALIMRVHWSEVQGSGHGEAEQSGYLVVDHSPAHRGELVHSQNVQ